MKRNIHHTISSCLTLATVAATAMTVVMRARAQAVTPLVQGSARPPQTERAAGRKVHIDPATGKIIEPPLRVPGQLPPPLPPVDDRHSTSTEGLRMTPVTTRAGGVKVNLQGRFRHNVEVVTGADGKPASRCRADEHAHEDKTVR